MTKEQIYHRRLARKYGKRAAESALAGCETVYEPFTIRTVAKVAREAAWHAFQAHPELREPTAFRQT